MGKRVHGHEVRKMVIESGKNYTREALISAINETFGEDAEFFSCAADNMTADELISFFEKNGKISAPNYNFAESAGHSCNHEH